jgi:hypothetical protein
LLSDYAYVVARRRPHHRPRISLCSIRATCYSPAATTRVRYDDSMKKAGKPKESGKPKKHKLAGSKAKARRLTIGLAGFEKISAIEGLHLTRDMKRTFSALERQGASAAQRRAAIIKRYG